ncbi:hypothetical protein [Pseudomonas donghuensis]|uniref:hypothetical protein n=1 Tax=Pseudomonas donghuensis TaxID=1163398 RepID=UPI00215F8407|nr:hypothetical protein [Pseudomonas donghuensis]UVL22543.1 hypothetical protein LOY30_16975 [Pseudomonas donghuensis]UVL27704.1 hypothetical protein LOY32_15980 [Pseudomonas donghuensis]
MTVPTGKTLVIPALERFLRFKQLFEFRVSVQLLLPGEQLIMLQALIDPVDRPINKVD